MGCEVFVFSGTNTKKEEATKLEGKELYCTKGLKELKVKPMDHLIVTTAAQLDWSVYLPVMAASGTIYPLSISEGDLKDNLVAAREIHREMLDFAAVYNIRPIIATFPMSVEDVKDAFKKLEEGVMRYCGILVV